MQNLDSGAFKIRSPHPALLGTNVQKKPLTHIPDWKFEEEDRNSFSIPESPMALKDWWEKFNQGNEYPLYCMILATRSDEHIASLIDKYRQELANMAGDKCCIIYFRDIEKAKLLDPFQFEEHARGVEQFIKIIDVQQNQLPCVLFFEQITNNDFVLIRMEQKTIEDSILFFRDLFTFIYSHREVSLHVIKMYKLSVLVKATGKSIMGGIVESIDQVRKEVISEMVKSLLVKSP